MFFPDDFDKIKKSKAQIILWGRVDYRYIFDKDARHLEFELTAAGPLEEIEMRGTNRMGWALVPTPSGYKAN